jgi:PAS domain S-box-containing protein
VAVRLPQLPLALYRAWQQHADALLREHLLASFDEGADPGDLEQHGQASDAFTALTQGVAQAAGAADRGGIDVVLHLSPTTVQQFVVLDAVLDKVAALAARGELLAPPTQPEVQGLRRWINQQVARQSAGLTAEAWAGIEAGAPPPERAPVAWDDAEVTAASVAVVAADDANRLIAVSAAAAELLGWQPADLLGRRIVTIIPERFREAHVAAFTLHLLSGEARILGRPVTVPALRRDGTEIMVELLVRRETERGDQHRAVFVAQLTPVSS